MGVDFSWFDGGSPISHFILTSGNTRPTDVQIKYDNKLIVYKLQYNAMGDRNIYEGADV